MKTSVPFWRRLLIATAILSLACGLLYTRLAPQPDPTPAILSTLASGERLGAGDRLWPILDQNGGQAGYVAISTQPGYGGPLTMAVRIDTEGKVVAVDPIDHKESPGFMLAVARAGFFKQFAGLNANAPFQLGHDLQGVTGATITSKAIAGAVRDGSHAVARTPLGLTPPQQPLLSAFGLKEWALLAMFTLSLLLWRFNLTRFRLPFLALSTVVMGFWLGAVFAIPQLTALLMGYAPPLQEAVRWYMVVGGVLILTALVGHTWYCYWLCPFGGAQELLALVGGNMLKSSLTLRRALGWLRWLVLWASAMTGFLTLSPSTGGVEPFSTLFLFKGTNTQWALLLTVLVSAVFVPRIWCHFLCPVGALREGIDRIRRGVMNQWKRRRKGGLTI